MARKEELKRIKKQNKDEAARGRRVNRKAEDGKEEDVVQVAALDRSHKEVLSTSPLKLRVDYDLRPEGVGRESSPDQPGLGQSVEYAMTPSRSSKKPTAKSPGGKSTNISIMMQSKQKSILKNSGIGGDTTIGSPSKLKSSGASAFKTPARNQGPLDSAMDFNDQTLARTQTSTEIELHMVNLFRE